MDTCGFLSVRMTRSRGRPPWITSVLPGWRRKAGAAQAGESSRPDCRIAAAPFDVVEYPTEEGFSNPLRAANSGLRVFHFSFLAAMAGVEFPREWAPAASGRLLQREATMLKIESRVTAACQRVNTLPETSPLQAFAVSC